jgi:hypothetical protein
MAKSLIKTVDGIGIWVKDDSAHSTCKHNSQWYIRIAVLSTVVMAICALLTVFNILDRATMIAIYAFCAVLVLVCFLCDANSVMLVQAYEVYAGSQSGIVIPKTNDEKADQIAICKAAKEIEIQCHKIAEKRKELDRIAENCK